MKKNKLSKVFGLSLLALTSSGLFAENIVAMKINDSIAGIKDDSELWANAKEVQIKLYSQTTVTMNDKITNDKNSDVNSYKVAKIKALYNDNNEVAFLIRWKDGTKSVQEGYKTDSYGDGFAVQFPTNFSDASKLPYIGMGSEGREVLVHLQKAVPNVYEPNGNGNVELQIGRKNTNYFNEELKQFDDEVKKLAKVDYQKSFVSAGFRSMTEIKDGSTKADMTMIYNMNHGCWKGIVSRNMKDEYIDLNKSSFPIAIAVWDGDKNNRDGTKLLSSWQTVSLSGREGGEALVSEVSKTVEGNLTNGKAQFEANCASCHITSEMKSAPQYMAPELTNIGGYSTLAYIRESIIDPNAVIVPGYNRNAHKNFEWYQVVDGKRNSAMPSFNWLEESVINDIVSYVQTLKAQEEKK